VKLELAVVLDLLHGVPAATLATQSQQMSGYPYATVVPNVLDEQHRPVLLISALAEHTKNLLADPKVSVSVTESGIANVQDGQRLTLVGDAEQFSPSQALIARYLRYVPVAEQYLALDFMFFRIQPRRLRYIGGVGRMGWLEADAFVSANALPLAEEAALLTEAQAAAPGNVALLGIDTYGIDYLADGFRGRQSLGDENLNKAVLAAAAKLGR
jgi:putative heme iron utilization protein